MEQLYRFYQSNLVRKTGRIPKYFYRVDDTESIILLNSIGNFQNYIQKQLTVLQLEIHITDRIENYGYAKSAIVFFFYCNSNLRKGHCRHFVIKCVANTTLKEEIKICYVQFKELKVLILLIALQQAFREQRFQLFIECNTKLLQL